MISTAPGNHSLGARSTQTKVQFGFISATRKGRRIGRLQYGIVTVKPLDFRAWSREFTEASRSLTGRVLRPSVAVAIRHFRGRQGFGLEAEWTNAALEAGIPAFAVLHEEG